MARVFVVPVALVAGLYGGPLRAQSYFPSRPDDSRAVDFTKETFGAHADGVGDDAEALQQAINRVPETTRIGVVLIPEGRYSVVPRLRDGGWTSSGRNRANPRSSKAQLALFRLCLTSEKIILLPALGLRGLIAQQ